MNIPTLVVKCSEEICGLQFPIDDWGVKEVECPNCYAKVKIR